MNKQQSPRPGMTRTGALRATTRRYVISREGNVFRVVDRERVGSGVTAPDYWRARAIATRWRAEECLQLMGMKSDDAAAGVDWAIGKGHSTVGQIVEMVSRDI